MLPISSAQQLEHGQKFAPIFQIWKLRSKEVNSLEKNHLICSWQRQKRDPGPLSNKDELEDTGNREKAGSLTQEPFWRESIFIVGILKPI